jgi:hypothetical protein
MAHNARRPKEDIESRKKDFKARKSSTLDIPCSTFIIQRFHFS